MLGIQTSPSLRLNFGKIPWGKQAVHCIKSYGRDAFVLHLLVYEEVVGAVEWYLWGEKAWKCCKYVVEVQFSLYSVIYRPARMKVFILINTRILLNDKVCCKYVVS